MRDWQFDHGNLYKTYGLDTTPLALGAFLQAHASANTKASSWTSLGTLDYNCYEMVVVFQASSTALRDYLVDVAVGGSGSEVVMYSNLFHSQGADNQQGFHYRLPCNLPAGTQISARCQSSTGSESTRITVICLASSFWFGRQGGIVTSYGLNTGTTNGTACPDASNDDHTKGAWTALATSLTYNTRMMLLVQGNLRTASVADCFRLVDVGVGASSSEVVAFADIRTRSLDGPDHHLPAITYIPCNLPAGTRVSVRSAINQSIVGATWQGALYGIS